MKVSELWGRDQCTQVPESLDRDATTSRDQVPQNRDNSSEDLQKRNFCSFLVDIISIVA